MKRLAKYALAAAVALTAVTGAQAAEMKELKFGILAVESQDHLMKRWGPVIERLSERSGMKVEPFFASDYTGVIEAQRFNKVDIVHYGNKSAMTAVDRSGAEVFAKTVEKDGSQGYYSILVTHKDNTNINNLKDVLACNKSIDFGIGDPQSTSGFLVPTTFVFAANEVEPRDCFKTVRNASHEANLLSVANKQVDVATANNRALYIRLKANNPKAYDSVKEIWRSPLIPSDPLAWRKNLPEEVKAKIMYTFLGIGRIGDEETLKKDRAALQNAGWGGFLPSSNLQLLPIREMEFTKEMVKVQNDETRTEAEKKKLIAELKEKIRDVRAKVAALPNM